MKNTFVVIPLVFLLSFIVGCQQGEEVTSVDVEAVTKHIKESYVKWENAINSADLDEAIASSSYSDNVIIIPPNEPANVGKEALRSYFQQIFDRFNVQEKCTVENVKISGSLAIAHSLWSGVYEPKEGGTPINSKGNSIEVFQKQSDNEWKIIYSIWSDEYLIYPEQAE